MKSKVKKSAGIFRRSILLKYLTVSLSIILVCMIAMGIAMLFFVANSTVKTQLKFLDSPSIAIPSEVGYSL